MQEGRIETVGVRAAVCAWALSAAMLWYGFYPQAASGAQAVPKELQRLYEKKEYANVIDAITKLSQEAAGAPDVRRLKIRSLLKLGRGKEALQEYDGLEAALKQDDLPLLREIAFNFIVAMTKDMREQMRGAAYTALKEVDADDAVPWFEDGLSDGSGAVRVLAVEGLGRSERGRRSPKLRQALEDEAGLVKARAVKVLGRTNDPTVIPLIEKASRDELNTVRIAAYGALVRLGRKEAWDSLRQAADAANPEDRAEAIRVIADLKEPRGVPLLVQLLDYQQPSVRGTAARGLGHMGYKEARERIESLLRDPVPAVRESAASGLAELGTVESVPVLNKALQDGHYTVRAAASAALLQLNQPFDTVAATLLGLAQQNDIAARAAAAHALGRATAMNRGGALSLLGTLTKDPLPGPRIVALRSLGHVGDPALVPLMKEALHDENEAVRATGGGALLHVLSEKRL